MCFLPCEGVVWCGGAVAYHNDGFNSFNAKRKRFFSLSIFLCGTEMWNAKVKGNFSAKTQFDGLLKFPHCGHQSPNSISNRSTDRRYLWILPKKMEALMWRFTVFHISLLPKPIITEHTTFLYKNKTHVECSWWIFGLELFPHVLHYPSLIKASPRVYGAQ